MYVCVCVSFIAWRLVFNSYLNGIVASVDSVICCWCCCAVSIFIKRLICQNKPQMCPWPSANKLWSSNKFKCDAIWCGFHEYLFFMGMIIVMVDVCMCMCICVAAVSIMTESSLNLGKLRWAANKEKYSCKSSRQHQKPLTIKSSLFLYEGCESNFHIL